MTSNHVLAIKAVLADGSIVEMGEESLEGVGADTVGLFVGSEGLFGIALEITLRLLPRPEHVLTLLAAYDSLEAAGDAVARVVESGLLPGAMEIMDSLAIEAAEAAVSAGYPAAAALLIVELEGEEVVVEEEALELRRLIDASGPTEVRIATDAQERALIWKGRKGAFSAVGRLSPDYIVGDGVVPRTRLGEALREVQSLSKERGLRVANVFHAGDGNLHPLILFDGRQSGALEKAEELAGEILRMCVRLGGSITGEHGVGMEKRDYLGAMFSSSDIEAMKDLRACFDPKGLSNPGKMFPDGEAPALAAHGPHPLERAGVISRE
jgi:glycolate oxidase